MAEQSNRLDLIQRAVKRLASEGETVGEMLRPAGEPDSSISNREALAVAAPQPSHAAPESLDAHRPGPIMRGTAAPIRLNYAEFRRRGMITPEKGSSGVTFEFRAIKRKLLASARAGNSNAIAKNLIMVTSALPGEGKTFTATNLALSLATERDLHVLLIDADVIKPTVGTLFEPFEGAGLTDLLNGNCNNLGDITHPCTDIPNLSVVFAGSHDQRTPELISSRRTADIFLDLSQKYPDRVVIFDTPPVLGSAEPATLAMYMHQIVMVVAGGAANRSQVQRALENISACPNISMVFNKAPKWHKPDADPYYYYGSNSISGTLSR